MKLTSRLGIFVSPDKKELEKGQKHTLKHAQLMIRADDMWNKLTLKLNI